MSVRVHGLREIEIELTHFEHALPDGSAHEVKQALGDIERLWKGFWTHRFAHAPRIHMSITNELTEESRLKVTGVVGPEDGPLTQGFLGAILELGGINSGPHPGGIPASEIVEPKVEEATVAMTERLLP